MAVEGDIRHIAVLVCDTPISGITEKFGDFGDNIIDLLQNAGNCQYPIVKYQVAFGSNENDSYEEDLKRVYERLTNHIIGGFVQGIILSGSRSDSFAQDIPWIDKLNDFIKYAFALESLPIVGICFGHQVIAKNLGCKVGRNSTENGWECGTTTINLNTDIMAIKDSPFLDVLKADDSGFVIDHLNVVEFHQDIVYGLPPTAVLEKKKTNVLSIGSSNKCSIQGLITESGPLKILTFQGHPEFSIEEAKDFLKTNFEKGLIDKKLFEKCTYNTSILNNQGSLLGKVIGNFITSFNK
mmetsp:Transcript_7230/g.9145  ORF Transcript_7230/g.9145 Transcript_7230/m.9145 type:complete len:296 (-) Transcript_7230:10-897(-)